MRDSFHHRRHPSRPRLLSRSAVAVGLLTLASTAATSAAQAENWTGGSGVNSLWSNPANWFSQAVPPPNSSIRVGSPAMTAPVLDSSRVIAEFELARFADSSLEVLNNAALQLNGTSASLIRSTNLGAFVFKPRVVAAGNGAIQGFLFGGNLLFSGGLTVNAGNTVTVSHLAGDKSITLAGPILLASGATLSLDHGGGNSVYSASSTDLQNATLRSRRQATYTFTPNFVPTSTGQLVLADGNVTLVGTLPSGVSTTLESGTVNLSAADAFGTSVTNNGTVNITTTTGYTLTSAMSGNGSVRFTGGSSRLFMGINAKSYTGETRVVSGIIQPLSNTGLSPQSTVVLESPATAIDTRTRSITIGGLAGSGRIYDGLGSTVTLTVGNNNQSTLFSGSIQGTGSVDTGIINLVKNGTGQLDLTGNNTTIGTVTINSGSLRLNSISPIALSLNNRIVNSGNVIFNVSMGDILYGSQINSGGTLTKTGGFALTLTNLNAVSGSVQILSGNLVLAGISTPNIPASISNSGQLTLNLPATVTGPISGTGALVKGGTSTVELHGHLSYTGNTTVNAGVLRVFSPLRPVTGALTVSGGTANLEPNPATLAATASVVAGEFSSLSISNAALLNLPTVNRSLARPNLLITSTLSIAPTGFLDLTNNDLIVRNQSPASVRSLVRTWLTADNGLPGPSGLGSSLAFYTPNGAFTTLAVYDNSIPGHTLTTFNGIAVAPTHVLVKYTYLGDTNLDGVVNATDLSRLLQGLNSQGSGWNFGDVNHDGVIDAFDLGRTLAALRGQGAPLGSTLGGQGTGGGTIPEPNALSLLLLPALTLRRKR